MTSIEKVFDNYAANYDAAFTDTWLGGYYRKRVQEHMQAYWPSGHSILELNAGTGEDARFLASSGNRILATDSSPGMLEVANLKIARDGYCENVEFRQLRIEEMDVLEGMRFDGILSNFGGLNCIDNLDQFALSSANIVNKDGIVILCLMGRWVPWEWLWFTCRGEPRKGFRRFSGKSVWNGADIYYPKVSDVVGSMKKASFRLICTEALGVIMPPSYVNGLVSSWPNVFKAIGGLEKLVSKKYPFSCLADHYLLVFKKL